MTCMGRNKRGRGCDFGKVSKVLKRCSSSMRKMAGDGGGRETTGDIQDYLADPDSKNSMMYKVKVEVGEVVEEGVTLGFAEASDGGQYFVDQATGQCYLQSTDGKTLTEVHADDPVRGGDHSVLLDDKGMVVEDKTAKGELTFLCDQVVPSAVEDKFQEPTILPNELACGEVSYVVVQQNEENLKFLVELVENEEKKDGGEKEDLAGVDHFEAGEEDAEYDEDDPEEMHEDKAKVVELKANKGVERRHNCNFCNYTTPKRYLLSRHMKSHSDERPHKCSVCEQGFKTLSSLQNHMNIHTKTKPYRCKYCEASFTTSGVLGRHVRYKHTQEKPHKCPDCDYTAVERSKLKRHMRWHSGEKPYQCHHCTYASHHIFGLKRHLRVHTGEKPYKCDICHARFTQRNSLKEHRAIHTGDKPVYQVLMVFALSSPEPKIIHYFSV